MNSWVIISILGLQLFMNIMEPIALFDYIESHGGFYFLSLFTQCISLLIGIFITKRKYRMPRKHILSVCLVCGCLSMILLSIKGVGPIVSEVIILILAKVLFGIGIASTIYINITIFCSLSIKYFDLLLSFLIGIGIIGSLISQAILKFSLSRITSFSIAIAVISIVFIPCVRRGVGDLQYSLTSERYTVLQFINKPVIFTQKQAVKFFFLVFIFFERAFILYCFAENVESLIVDNDLSFLAFVIDCMGGLTALSLIALTRIKLEKPVHFIIAGAIYFLSFFLIGPWEIILPGALWISFIGIAIHGFCSFFFVVALTLKILNCSIYSLNFQIEALLCECIGAMYLISYSLGNILGPIAAVIFQQFLAFDSCCSMLGFGELVVILASLGGIQDDRHSVHILETAPAENHEPISDNRNQSLPLSHKDYSDPIPEPPSELISIKRDTPSAYDYNYLSIQAGYSSSKQFTSMKFEMTSEKESSSTYGNISLPVKLFSSIEDTIEEQKEEDSIGEIKENEVPEIPKAIQHRLPVFKEVKVELDPVEQQVVGSIRIKEESKEDSSKDVIQDLDGMFPNISYQ